mgnify:CR=1 FL=1
MTIFANALATIKAIDTTTTTPTSLQVATYDVLTTVAMKRITNKLDLLVEGNIEGWYGVGNAMMYEGEDFTVKVDGIDIEVAINLPARADDVDTRTLVTAMDSYISKWESVRPKGVNFEMILRMGDSGLYVSESFRMTLEERKAAKEQSK